MIDEELAQEIKGIVHGIVPGAKVILYGSQVRGEASAESDIDLLILSPTLVTGAVQQRLNQVLYDLELDRAIVLSSLVYELTVWEQPKRRSTPLYQNVAAEGIVL